jgi:hypothetical protein
LWLAAAVVAKAAVLAVAVVLVVLEPVQDLL